MCLNSKTRHLANLYLMVILPLSSTHTSIFPGYKSSPTNHHMQNQTTLASPPTAPVIVVFKSCACFSRVFCSFFCSFICRFHSPLLHVCSPASPLCLVPAALRALRWVELAMAVIGVSSHRLESCDEHDEDGFSRGNLAYVCKCASLSISWLSAAAILSKSILVSLRASGNRTIILTAYAVEV
jgi:hypothetical protein